MARRSTTTPEITAKVKEARKPRKPASQKLDDVDIDIKEQGQEKVTDEEQPQADPDSVNTDITFRDREIKQKTKEGASVSEANDDDDELIDDTDIRNSPIVYDIHKYANAIINHTNNGYIGLTKVKLIMLLSSGQLIAIDGFHGTRKSLYPVLTNDISAGIPAPDFVWSKDKLDGNYFGSNAYPNPFSTPYGPGIPYTSAGGYGPFGFQQQCAPIPPSPLMSSQFSDDFPPFNLSGEINKYNETAINKDVILMYWNVLDSQRDIDDMRSAHLMYPIDVIEEILKPCLMPIGLW